MHLDAMAEPTTHGVPAIADYDQKTVGYHLRLLSQTGLIEVKNPAESDGIYIPAVLSMSWAGHEFLDSVRNPHVWKQTKSAAERLSSWTLSTLAELAKGYIKAEAYKFGLPIS